MAIGDKWYFEDAQYDMHTRKTVHVVREVEITGETPRKWTWVDPALSVWHDGKTWSIPKTGGEVREARRQNGSRVYTRTVYASLEALERAKAEREEKNWAQAHRYNISKMVERLDDSATLRQIAALVGYKEMP